MNTAYLMISIMIIGGGETTITRTVNHGVAEMKQCDDWMNKHQGYVIPKRDIVTDRPVKSVTYGCVRIGQEEQTEILNAAKAG